MRKIKLLNTKERKNTKEKNTKDKRSTKENQYKRKIKKTPKKIF